MAAITGLHKSQLAALSEFYGKALESRKFRHVDLIAHTLRLKDCKDLPLKHIDILKRCIFRAIDLEWFESGPQRITEIGIAELDLLGTATKPIIKIQNMRVHHMRLKDTAHLVNGLKCKGHPEEFSFGKTTFVNNNEANEALKDIFNRRDRSGNLQPIVLIGHAVDNDIDILRGKFNFDLAALGNVIMVLDTQVMASELGMNGQRKMSLQHTLQQFSIHEPHLHNAGNDVGQTMVAAALLAGVHATGEGRYMEENQKDVSNLKTTMRKSSTSYWGTPRFCTNCESAGHMVGQCPNHYWCQRCAAIPFFIHRASTHPIEKCRLPETPCKACSESELNYRRDGAPTHYSEDCPVDKSLSKNA